MQHQVNAVGTNMGGLLGSENAFSKGVWLNGKLNILHHLPSQNHSGSCQTVAFQHEERRCTTYWCFQAAGLLVSPPGWETVYDTCT
jgi:hypothetical protein